MTVFTPDVVDAVLRHMNADHPDDNVLIVRAFSGRDATAASLTDVTEHGGTWRYQSDDDDDELELHLPWSQELTERPQIRHEIVALYDAACGKLGVEPRPHE